MPSAHHQKYHSETYFHGLFRTRKRWVVGRSIKINKTINSVSDSEDNSSL